MDGWHSIIDAKGILGCSDDTIRRNIKSGKLEAKRVGGKWLVYIPGSGEQDGPPLDEVTEPEPDADSAEFYAQAAEEAAERLRIQLEAIGRELQEARTEAGWLRERMAFLEAALTHEREARTEEARRADTMLMSTLALVPRQLEDFQAPRPWWKRLLGR